MHLRYLSLLLFSLIFTFASAKQLGMEVSYAEFMDENNQAYLELYFALSGQSVDYRQLENGRFVGGAEITVTLKRNDTIVQADKFRLLSPELEDTSAVMKNFIQQVRFPVQKGNYILNLKIEDINEPQETYDVEQAITTNLGGSQLAASQLVFLNSYTKTDSKSMFSKSGYELIPLVSSGDLYFSEAAENISFYTEIYNTAEALGSDEAYVIKYYIKNYDNNKVLNKYASFSKRKTSEVEPLLASLDISKLNTGNYQLVVDVLNKDGEVVLSQSRFFFRKNAQTPITANNVGSEQDMAIFLAENNSLDSVFLFIKYLYPISTERDRRYQKELMAVRDMEKMKTYFFNFWNTLYPEDPAEAWQTYYENVKIANNKFGSSLRPGYLTDRGRVFLMYGKPDMIDSRMMSSSNPPYEIWQYGRISTPFSIPQTNKIFVFAEFNPSTQEYELFHSTAVGELSSRRWRYDMALRYAGASGDIDDDFNGGRDNFGNRINDNILLNTTGSDRENR